MVNNDWCIIYSLWCTSHLHLVLSHPKNIRWYIVQPISKNIPTPSLVSLSDLSIIFIGWASSKIFYWPFQGGTSFVDLLCFCSVLCLLCFVRVCLYVLCGHLLGKGWPLGSRLWCLLWVCHFPIGILGQVWYLIVSIPDLCTITYFYSLEPHLKGQHCDYFILSLIVARNYVLACMFCIDQYLE